MSKPQPHSDAEADAFIIVLDQYILSKLVHMNIVHARGVMPLSQAAKQLKAYIQPLLSYPSEEETNNVFTS